MFGYSIKEVLEDNSMDIYMIMEALDTQKIHWYLKRNEYRSDRSLAWPTL